MTSEAKQEVARLLLAGEKTSAIQYLSDTYTISLQDAKLLVETLEAEISTGSIVSANPLIESSTALDGKLKGEVILLLQTKGKIEAVKYVKMHLVVFGEWPKDWVFSSDLSPFYLWAVLASSFTSKHNLSEVVILLPGK